MEASIDADIYGGRLFLFLEFGCRPLRDLDRIVVFVYRHKWLCRPPAVHRRPAAKSCCGAVGSSHHFAAPSPPTRAFSRSGESSRPFELAVPQQALGITPEKSSFAILPLLESEFEIAV
jgi:hypothetical protein